MLKIQKIFFCDNVELSQFNKRNFIGVILAKEIEISVLPYKFLSNLVIIGETTRECKIILELANENVLFKSVELDIKLGKLGIINGIEFTIPVVFEISRLGKILIRILNEEEVIFLDEYEFTIGESSYLNQNRHLPNSGLLLQSNGSKFVNEVISLAKKSVILIDNHIRNHFELSKLLKNISDSNVEILVFTKSIYKKNIESEKPLFLEYPNLKIYFTTPTQEVEFHDRFLIVDRTEYYSFGASLNDISGKKISGFKKITSEMDIKAINQTIASLIY